jgi:hypothetical protein
MEDHSEHWFVACSDCRTVTNCLTEDQLVGTCPACGGGRIVTDTES